MKGKNNSSLTRKQKRLQLQPKPDDGVSVKPGEPLNGALSALAGTSTGDGVVMSDAVEAPPDLKSLIVTHAKVVEDVPKFTAKVKAWLEFFVTYEAADDDTKAQVRTQAMQGQRFIEQALFDNASVTTKRVAWHMVLVRKFQKTFANLVEVADYLAQLCKDGYLVELKAGVRSPLRIYEEVRFDSQQREVIGGYEAFYGFPATSQDDPEPII
ncbi:MAG: hypothetical protein NTY04_01450, partial [Candidatus Staskawiczbacteria bacterium]|nr:hypothetical protein [Candidatus Staskawiczbacteria bacterium]